MAKPTTPSCTRPRSRFDDEGACSVPSSSTSASSCRRSKRRGEHLAELLGVEWGPVRQFAFPYRRDDGSDAVVERLHALLLARRSAPGAGRGAAGHAMGVQRAFEPAPHRVPGRRHGGGLGHLAATACPMGAHGIDRIGCARVGRTTTTSWGSASRSSTPPASASMGRRMLGGTAGSTPRSRLLLTEPDPPDVVERIPPAGVGQPDVVRALDPRRGPRVLRGRRASPPSASPPTSWSTIPRAVSRRSSLRAARRRACSPRRSGSR